MPRSRIVLVSIAIVVLLAPAFLLWMRRSAADEPGYIERTLARHMRNLAIPRSARKQVNPWTATPIEGHYYD